MNLLVVIGLLVRFAMAFVYINKIGKGYLGLRKNFAIVSSVVNISLAVVIVFAIF